MLEWQLKRNFVSMKKVKFIKSLNVEEVFCIDRADFIEYSSFNTQYMVPIRSSSLAIIDTSNTVKKHAVPIHEIFEYNLTEDGIEEREETYIAISEEVEKLLGKPYSSLKQENSDLTQELIGAWATIRENKNRIAELEKWNKEGCNAAVKLHQALIAQIIAMNAASWWRRLFKKWG